MAGCKHNEAHVRLVSRGDPLRYRYTCTSCGRGPEMWSATGDEARQEWKRFKKAESAPRIFGSGSV